VVCCLHSLQAGYAAEVELQGQGRDQILASSAGGALRLLFGPEGEAQIDVLVQLCTLSTNP